MSCCRARANRVRAAMCNAVRRLKFLLYDPAGDARAAATQGRRLVGIIVAAGVNHKRAALYVGQLEVLGDDRIGGIAATIDTQRREVAFVALTARPEMFAGVSR